MKAFDLFNASVSGVPDEDTRPGEFAPSSGRRAPQSPTVQTFVTPQSLVSFPLAAGLVSGFWKAAQVLLPEIGKSPWVGLAISLLVGGLIYLISSQDPRVVKTTRDKWVQVGIGIINCIYLFLAALGIKVVT